MATRKTISIYFLARQVNSSFVNILLVLSLKGLSPIIHLICRKCFIPYKSFPELFFTRTFLHVNAFIHYTRKYFFVEKRHRQLADPVCFTGCLSLLQMSLSYYFNMLFSSIQFLFNLLCRLNCTCCHNIDACTCHIFKDNITDSHRCLNCHAF